MTIRSSINASALNERWSKLERCAEVAPKGAYEEAKQIAQAIGEIANGIIASAAFIGLKCNNSDKLREVEAVIYGLLVDSNPDATVFAVSEGFGEHVDGPAGERVMANCIRDMQALRIMGVIKDCPEDRCTLSYGEGTREDPDRCVSCGALFLRDAKAPFAFGEVYA